MSEMTMINFPTCRYNCSQCINHGCNHLRTTYQMWLIYFDPSPQHFSCSFQFKWHELIVPWGSSVMNWQGNYLLTYCGQKQAQEWWKKHKKLTSFFPSLLDPFWLGLKQILSDFCRNHIFTFPSANSRLEKRSAVTVKISPKTESPFLVSESL